MKKYTLLTLVLIPILKLYGQTDKPLAEGKVSYITLQNIYARFESVGLVQPGDTVFIRKDQVLTPLFVAESVSSTSCVGKPMAKFDIKESDAVFVKVKKKVEPAKLSRNIGSDQQNSGRKDSARSLPSIVHHKSITESGRKQRIRGRVGASSYSSFSNSSDFNQRMRYTFSLSAQNISGGRFSFESYILFTHKLNHWADVRDNVFKALKIYSLNVSYDIADKVHLSFGRKINFRIASVGAIDGFQGETKLGNFTVGVVVGTNPDYTDYRFNPKLFEYGGYLSHDVKTETGNMTTSVAFLQQTNRGMTDRRFAYFQHDNSLIKNVNLFASCELDLYALQNGIPSNTVSLTSLYLSLNYRFSNKLSAYVSYDARKNVIYYETFRNYLDQLLVDATRQGYQMRMNYRPTNKIFAGVSGGYRFQKNDPNPMQNVNAYLTFNEVPIINSSVSLSSNWLNTSYVDGFIYGIRLYRDLIPSKLSSGIFYRLVDYTYTNTSAKSLQHMAEFELNWQIRRKLSLSANYDGTFDKTNTYHSIYLSLIQRF
ncbi:MAG: hypothetical protein WC384_08670 [Prolixibacteraceae bacterium]|jgi:hypothetical protein